MNSNHTLEMLESRTMLSADLTSTFGQVKLPNLDFQDGTTRCKAAVVVANVGDARAKGMVTVRLVLSTDGTVSDDDIILAETTRRVSLKAGRGKSISRNFKIVRTGTGDWHSQLCQLIDDGQYRLLADVSFAGEEISGENNNTAGPSVRIESVDATLVAVADEPADDSGAERPGTNDPITPPADETGEDLSGRINEIPSFAIAGEASTVQVAIRNDGPASGTIDVDVLALIDAAAAPTVLGSVSVDLVTATRSDGLAFVDVPVTVPADMLGETTWVVRIDSANAVAEADETNNDTEGRVVEVVVAPDPGEFPSLPGDSLVITPDDGAPLVEIIGQDFGRSDDYTTVSGVLFSNDVSGWTLLIDVDGTTLELSASDPTVFDGFSSGQWVDVTGQLAGDAPEAGQTGAYQVQTVTIQSFIVQPIVENGDLSGGATVALGGAASIF